MKNLIKKKIILTVTVTAVMITMTGCTEKRQDRNKAKEIYEEGLAEYEKLPKLGGRDIILWDGDEIEITEYGLITGIDEYGRRTVDYPWE